MAIEAVNTITPKRNNAHTMLLGTTGAVLGAASRYYLPTKDELSLIKTHQMDSFFSTAKSAARAQSRSILKYAGIGALIAAGIGLIVKLIKDSKLPKQNQNQGKIEYTKMGALIDASDYACEIMWWGE